MELNCRRCDNLWPHRLGGFDALGNSLSSNVTAVAWIALFFATLFGAMCLLSLVADVCFKWALLARRLTNCRTCDHELHEKCHALLKMFMGKKEDYFSKVNCRRCDY